MSADTAIFNRLRSLPDYMKAEEEFQMRKQMQRAQLDAQRAKVKSIENYDPMQDAPAPIKINAAIDKALKAGDYDTANRIAWLSRSQAYGVDTFGPQGNTPETFQPFKPKAPIEAAPIGPQAQSEYVPTGQSIMGGNSIAQQLARKAALESGAKERSKLVEQLELKPKIKQAEQRAGYLEEGFQSLPKVQRSLQSKELKEEFLAPKINEIANTARGAWSSTGFTGALSGAVPGTPAYNLRAQVQTLLANAGFDRLQEMRDNSPTGGALGQVSEMEIQLLQAAAENLLNSQNEDQFIQNLENFRRQRLRTLQNVRQAYQEDYQRFGGASDRFLPSPQQMQEAQNELGPISYSQPNLPKGGMAEVDFNLRKAGFTPEQIEAYKKAKGLK